MNKGEFITAINQMSAPYNYDWDKKEGFNEYKKQTHALIPIKK